MTHTQSSSPHIVTAGATASLPFSPAVTADGLIYVSGTLGTDAKGVIVRGDIRTQTHQTFDNISATLAAARSSLASAASVMVYLRNASDFAAMNEAYTTYWTKDPPARTTVVVTQPLANADGLIEISMVAVKDASRKAVTPPNADGTPGTPSQHLSGAIHVGNRLYLSGSVGNTATNSGDVRAQTTEVLARAGRTLKAAGFDWSNVVDGVVYLPDMRTFPHMNASYREIFAKAFPARTTVGAGLMDAEANVEIMFTAVK